MMIQNKPLAELRQEQFQEAFSRHVIKQKQLLCLSESGAPPLAGSGERDTFLLSKGFGFPCLLHPLCFLS